MIDVKAALALLGSAVEAYRKCVNRPQETLRQAPDVAPKVIRDGGGPIVVKPRQDTDGSRSLVAKMGLIIQPLIDAN